MENKRRQTKTEEGLEYHMRHSENIEDKPTYEPSSTSLESVRSSYILAKSIDGLENSLIVRNTKFRL